ncbi:MAG: hypothetical protein ACK4F0_06830, partial [Candidatus Ratteibacteria bacterium]
MLEDKIEQFIYAFSIDKLQSILETKNKNFNFYEKRLVNYEKDIFKNIYQIGDVELKDNTKFGVFT